MVHVTSSEAATQWGRGLLFVLHQWWEGGEGGVKSAPHRTLFSLLLGCGPAAVPASHLKATATHVTRHPAKRQTYTRTSPRSHHDISLSTFYNSSNATSTPKFATTPRIEEPGELPAESVPSIYYGQPQRRHHGVSRCKPPHPITYRRNSEYICRQPARRIDAIRLLGQQHPFHV